MPRALPFVVVAVAVPVAFACGSDPGSEFEDGGNRDGVSGIDPKARWMWFDPQDGQSAFVGNDNNRTKTFLVFRLPASAIPPPPVK